MSETMKYDVVIVGAGPAGLSSAIRLKQLKPTLSVCLLEKASEVGGHILSGCVLEPRALNELLPNWRDLSPPSFTPVTSDKFYGLSASKRFLLPTPPQMNNHGNYIVSLANLCRWLGKIAEGMGVEIYPGFTGHQLIKDEAGCVKGITTGCMGLDRHEKPTDLFQPGLDLLADHVLIAEGCRGSLAEKIIKDYNLRDPGAPQTYGIGFKEVWQVQPSHHQLGHVEHSIGWPLDFSSYGGSFIYHIENNQVIVGFVVGLDYKNPYLSPFEEFQKFKTHPSISSLLHEGKRLSYGARALNEGGWQSIPKLVFPGGSLIGCSAGFMNVPKIKGTHTAMKSGMLAAEGFVHSLEDGRNDYDQRLRNSWVATELKAVRNIRPGFKFGLIGGILNAAFETYITWGKSPWTLQHSVDHKSLKLAKDCVKPVYPKADNKLTFDRLSSVFLCHIHHTETQPNHLKLQTPEAAISHNLALYDSPEQRYCPAGVYEIIKSDGAPYLQINSANCIHCKTCDIKDPLQNITWTPPEGGSGPNYGNM